MALNSLSRIGDIGIGTCPNEGSYITVFMTGTDLIKTDERDSCNVGTIGITTHGHISVALTGSEIYDLENLPAHRVGDIGICNGIYVAVTGSDITVIE